VLEFDAAYADTKAALVDVLNQHDADGWQRLVPATPAWSISDVVAHVTGLARDAAADQLPSDLNLLEQFRDETVVAARNAYADGKVAERRGRDFHRVLDEWHGAEPDLLARLRGDDRVGELPIGFDVVLVTDLCVHTDDVLGALGQPPRRDSAAARIALAGYCFGVDYRLRALGLPALAVSYDGKERTLGEGQSQATVAGDRWELLRAFAGRRSRAQLLALDWSGSPEPYLSLIPAYGERSDDLLEPAGTG
jgi:uncharacterized protein (TIGR03083 family)